MVIFVVFSLHFISVIMAVNVWCCGLLECANCGPAHPTSALRVSVRVTLASGIRPFMEAQEGLYRSQAFPINRYAARQRRLDNGVSLSIHNIVELFNHMCHTNWILLLAFYHHFHRFCSHIVTTSPIVGKPKHMTQTDW